MKTINTIRDVEAIVPVKEVALNVEGDVIAAVNMTNHEVIDALAAQLTHMLKTTGFDSIARQINTHIRRTKTLIPTLEIPTAREETISSSLVGVQIPALVLNDRGGLVEQPYERNKDAFKTLAKAMQKLMFSLEAEYLAHQVQGAVDMLELKETVELSSDENAAMVADEQYGKALFTPENVYVRRINPWT